MPGSDHNTSTGLPRHPFRSRTDDANYAGASTPFRRCMKAAIA